MVKAISILGCTGSIGRQTAAVAEYTGIRVAALTAMVAGCILVLLDPFHSADMPVYIVTAAIMAGVIWESVALMKLYNRSCSNPLPQFESHQGGEDRA